MKMWISSFLILFIFCLFFWLKFLREHLPREIPFNINFFTFCLHSFLILILFFSIFSFLFMKNTKNTLKERFLKLFLQKQSIVLPIFISETLFKILPLILKNLSKVIIFELFLRMLLCLIFLFDVIFFNKLFYTYKFVYIYLFIYIILLLLFFCTLISLINNKQLEQQTEIHFEGYFISIEDLIRKQVNQLRKENTLLPYSVIIKLDFIKKRHLELKLDKNQKLNAEFLIANVRKTIARTSYLSSFIDKYNTIKATKVIKILLKIITIIYFCLWCFILFKNLTNLNTNIFEIVDVSIVNNLEPFSQNKMI